MKEKVSKFVELQKYLESNKENRVTLHFSEIEKIIGTGLCESAYKYKAYWNPSKTHSMPNTILAAGYNIESVDLDSKIIFLLRINCELLN